MPASHARNIALTPQLSAYIDELVDSGEYTSASEVLRDGLRLLKVQREWRAAELNEIQARISAGLDQLDRGEGSTGPPAEVLGGILETVRKRRTDS